jgi:formylglycine-generating enzyme required for sulfatase activity
MNRFGVRLSGVVLSVVLMSVSSLSWANNLAVSSVTLGTRDAGANTVVVKFNVGWDNSWRTKINHDAVWLTVRLNDPNTTPTDKKLCNMSAAGLNPNGFSAGTQSGLEFYVPSDKKGVFLRRSENAPVGSIASQNAQVIIDYSSCGFSSSDQIKASVFGLEMVFVPQGSFYAGDSDTSAASLDQGSADSDPWTIGSESAISVSNPASDGYRYVSNNNPGENATGTTFSVPASFPKGYQAFYLMKYELTEGQWVEFINSLPGAARSHHDLTDNSHKGSDAVLSRNAISCSGSPLSCSTDRPWRALSYLSWMDLTAFLDWNALRPITELEFEKAARGPVLPINGEYAWGSTDLTAAATISGTQEDGTETVTTNGANAHFNDTTLSGGDSAQGAEYQKGPLRVGILSTDSTVRTTAGAGYYGVLDISGNLKERVVTIGNVAGRNFTGEHGDGILSTDASYEGNANATAWPGLDAQATRGVTGADGSGFRGGSWNDASDRLRISDRNEGALTATQALNTYGGRGARTYDGN